MLKSITALDLQDKLSHYRALEKHCMDRANRAALVCQIAERRYARACAFVRTLEKELKEAK